MERAKNKKGFGKVEPGPQLDSKFGYQERDRENCYVLGSADGEYGYVDGFRYGITHTGMRHKQSSLGKKVR